MGTASLPIVQMRKTEAQSGKLPGPSHLVSKWQCLDLECVAPESSLLTKQVKPVMPRPAEPTTQRSELASRMLDPG